MRWVVEQHGSTLGSTQVRFLVGTASGSRGYQAGSAEGAETRLRMVHRSFIRISLRQAAAYG